MKKSIAILLILIGLNSFAKDSCNIKTVSIILKTVSFVGMSIAHKYKNEDLYNINKTIFIFSLTFDINLMRRKHDK